MKAIAEQVIGKEAQFDLLSLSQVAWSFANLGIKHPQLFIGLAQHAVKTQLAECPAQALANFAWAFAKLDAHMDIASIPISATHMDSKELQIKVEKTTKQVTVAVSTPGSTSTSSTGLLLVSEPAVEESKIPSPLLIPAFLSALSHQALGKLDKFSRQSLTRFTFGMAKMGVSDVPLFQRLEVAIVKSYTEGKNMFFFQASVASIYCMNSENET